MNNVLVSTPGGALELANIDDAKIESGRLIRGSDQSDLLNEAPHFVELTRVTTRDGNYDVPNKETSIEYQAIEIANYICEWLNGKYAELMKLNDV